MEKPSHADSDQIRIIGGQWHGCKLPVPESPGLRPTTDWVREALFNWSTPSIVDTHCLYCFVGSDALRPEALSRYVASIALPEMERGVAQQLQKDFAILRAGRGKVTTTSALSFLSQPGTPHQIMFVDPPFRQELLEETLRPLETQGWLADEALVHVESRVENGLSSVPVSWQLYREKVIGQTVYRLYQRKVQGEHHAD